MTILRAASAAEIAVLQTSLDRLVVDLAGSGAGDMLAELVATIRIGPGQLSVTLDASALARHLEVAPERIKPDALDLITGLTPRRRGVEARLVLDDAPPVIDQTLLRNIARGHAWFAEVRSGTPIREIARRAGTTRQRVAAIVDLAFLAPDIVDSIALGHQPVTLTSERLIKSSTPALWSEQRTFCGIG